MLKKACADAGYVCCQREDEGCCQGRPRRGAKTDAEQKEDCRQCSYDDSIEEIDEEDLEVVSTHVQDAVLKVADVHWRPQEKRLVLGLNRFDWEGAQGARPKFQRRQSALRFERVLACRCRNVNQQGKDAVLNLLAVEFAEGDAPAGVVTLTFSGGGMLRLEVECLEAELADLGPVWQACACPAHKVEAQEEAKAQRAR